MRMPHPRSQTAHASLSAAQRASLPSGDPQSQSVHHTVTYRFAVRDAGFSGATGFLLQRQYTSSKHLCTLHTGVASWRALSMFAFKAARKVHRTVPVAVCAALCGRRELTACCAFSVLSSELSTTSRSSTGAHTKRIAAAQDHML